MNILRLLDYLLKLYTCIYCILLFTSTRGDYIPPSLARPASSMGCVQVQLRMQRFLVIFVALPCRNILFVVLYLPFQDAQVTWKQTYSRIRDDWR